MNTKTIIAAIAAAAAIGGGVTYLATRSAPGNPAPPGYWRYGSAVFTCSLQTPYTLQTNPEDGLPYYLMYDATSVWASDLPTDEAVSLGQGGAAHTYTYGIRIAANDPRSIRIPIATGNGILAPPPYRNMPVKNRPGQTLCDVWVSKGGNPSACPSNLPLTTYAAQIRTFVEWPPAWNYVNANIRTPQCNVPIPTPTAVPPTVVPPTSPPGVTPTVPPGQVPPCNCQPRPCILS